MATPKNVLSEIKPPYLHSCEDVAQTSYGTETEAEAIKSITRSRKVFRLYRITPGSGIWYIDKYDEAGANDVGSDHFIPGALMVVKAINTELANETGGWIEYDCPWNTHVLEYLACGLMHPIQVTKIWLGNYGTTFDNIWLHG